MSPAQLRNTSHSPLPAPPRATCHPTEHPCTSSLPQGLVSLVFCPKEKEFSIFKAGGQRTNFHRNHWGVSGVGLGELLCSAPAKGTGCLRADWVGSPGPSWALRGCRASSPGAGASSITRAAPTFEFITSSVLSPPPSLPELLGLAVPLASLGGS